MFTNINLLRLKISRFINGIQMFKKPKKQKNKKKLKRKQNDDKQEIYRVIKTDFSGMDQTYNSKDFKSLEFVFSYDDEVKDCFFQITKDFEEVYEIKQKYEQFRGRVNLQSLKSKRNFKIKFNENLFKTFEKTFKKLT